MEIWEQPQKPKLALASPAKPREDLGSASEYFKLRTDLLWCIFVITWRENHEELRVRSEQG